MVREGEDLWASDSIAPAALCDVISVVAEFMVTLPTPYSQQPQLKAPNPNTAESMMLTLTRRNP
jgi:hypothetical protein